MNDLLPLEAIFFSALERGSEHERAAYLDEACAGDPDLRRRVEKMLAAQAQAASFLERPAATFDTTVDEPVPERPGTVVGSYKLLEQIGEGGFGIVFMAEQTQPVRRKVALKVLKPGMDMRQVVARFEAERQALAIMDHPNIAKVFDGGATAGGRPYFVMELVKGVPITEFCDQNHLTPRLRLELFVAVCQAVQHAHQKGIIHRDLKPSNVLVTVHDTTPVPKVIDFGVAKALGQELTDKTMFTGFAQMIGTPLYMSPEQAGQSGLDVDTRSDIYSLGVLLYELLTGTTPIDGERFRKAAYDEIRRIIRDEEPPRPSTRLTDSKDTLASVSARRRTEPTKLTRLVRGELDWIVMKALEKDRNRRYDTANGFASDVQRYLNDEPVLACPPSAGYRFRKFARRNRGPVAAGLAMAALLVLGTVGTSLGLAWALRAENTAKSERDRALSAERLATDRLMEVTKEKERASAAETTAKEEGAIAQAVNDFLQNDLLAEAAPEKNARDKKVTVEEVLGRAAARIAGKFDQQPRTEAAIRQTIGDTYRALGDYPAAQPHLERALELRRRVLGDEHPDTLASTNNLAELYRDQGKYAKAEQLYAQALEVLPRVLGEQHPHTLKTMNNLALLHYARGQLAQAESLHAKTLELRQVSLGEDHLDTLASMNNLASVYEARNQLAKAEPLYVKVMELLGEKHFNTPTVMNNLAGLYRQQGQDAKAEPLFLKSLEISRHINGEVHPGTLLAMNNLGGFYWEAGQYAKAEPYFVKVLEVSGRVLTEEHPRTLASMNNLASLYQAQRQFAKAEPLYVKALELGRRVLKEEHPETLTYMSNLAGLYQAQRQYADAELLLRECLTIREKTKPNDWKTFNVRSLLGSALLGRKKYAEAEPLLHSGYEGMKHRETEIPPPDRRRVLTEALKQLWMLYEGWGKKDEAAKWRKEFGVYLETMKKNEKSKEQP